MVLLREIFKIASAGEQRFGLLDLSADRAHGLDQRSEGGSAATAAGLVTPSLSGLFFELLCRPSAFVCLLQQPDLLVLRKAEDGAYVRGSESYPAGYDSEALHDFENSDQPVESGRAHRQLGMLGQFLETHFGPVLRRRSTSPP